MLYDYPPFLTAHIDVLRHNNPHQTALLLTYEVAIELHIETSIIFTALAFVVIVFNWGLGSGYSLLHNFAIASLLMRATAHLLLNNFNIMVGTCYSFYFEVVAKDVICYVIHFEGYFW